MRIHSDVFDVMWIELRDNDSCYWCFPSYSGRMRGLGEVCRFSNGHCDDFGPPPSDTLRTLIECGAPWYAVLDKFVEEYPQWEEVLAWAPTANSEGE